MTRCHSGAERSEAIESMDPIGRPTDSLQGDRRNVILERNAVKR